MEHVLAHPILGSFENKKKVTFTVNGREMQGIEGEPIAAALLANGIKIFRYTAKFNEPRGLFCGIGQCTDCIMEVDGVPNVRTCVTPVKEGMKIKTQQGCGKWVSSDGKI